MIVKDYFTKNEIIEVLKSAEDYGEADFEGLFDSMVNNDDYILSTYEAAQALETFKNDEKLDGYETSLDGVFGAIEQQQNNTTTEHNNRTEHKNSNRTQENSNNNSNTVQ